MVCRRGMALGALLILLLAISAVAQRGPSTERLIQEITRALASERHGGVFDFGRLLKPGGVRELRDLAREFEQKGRRVWFVTVPPSTPANTIAETVYRRRGMDANDLLIVTNGEQVYGKTLALQGQAQAFREALEEARPAFRQYRAKGLAEYARRLEARIEGGAGSAQAPAAGTSQPEQPVGSGPVEVPSRAGSGVRIASIVIVLAVVAILVGVRLVRSPRIASQGPVYERRLSEATNLLSEAALAADQRPNTEHDTRLADLSQRLEELRRSNQREDTREVDLLVSDARSLLVDVRKEGRRA